jgi:hypothetical protein
LDVGDVSWAYFFKGGKELRPQLFVSLWTLLAPDQPVCGELALAIEAIHAVSLVLDDLPWMDNAKTRRGRPTLHRLFSVKKALLLCVDVLVMVYELWYVGRPVHISTPVWWQLLLVKLEELTVGQWNDVHHMGTLYDLAALKTGTLFALVVETVVACVGSHHENINSTWGRQLGVLFQWRDDWDDRDADEAAGQRNAFVEDYYGTIDEFEYMWEQLTSTCGKFWATPLGYYLSTYLEPPYSSERSKSRAIVHDPPSVMALYPYATFVQPHWYRVTSASEFLTKLAWVLAWGQQHMAEQPFERSVELEKLRHDLWYVDEELWEEQPVWQTGQDILQRLLFGKT